MTDVANLEPQVKVDVMIQDAVVREIEAQLSNHAIAGCRDLLYVMTIFSPPPIDIEPERKLCLILDYHRCYLYKRRSELAMEGIKSVLLYAQEQYTPSQSSAMAAWQRSWGFDPVYSLAAISYIFRFAPSLEAGDLVTTDFLTMEVRSSHPAPHPDVARVPVVTQIDSHWSEQPFQLSSCEAGKSLRSTGPPHRDEWLSRDAGPVQEETLRLWPGPIPSAVARASSPSPSLASIVGGKSLRARSALYVAECEALERFQIMYIRPDEALYYGNQARVGPLAFDPTLLFMGHRRARGTPWTPDSALYWTRAADPYRRTSVMVPAQSVWFTSRLRKEIIYAPCSTSGCALGSSNTEAAIFALLELIERDAYLVMWYLRRRCTKIDPASLDSDSCRMLLHVAVRDCPNYRFHFLDLRCDLPIPVVGVVATRESGRGPKTIHAAAARLSVEAAAEKGLQDVLIELANHLASDAPPEERSRDMSVWQAPKGPEDHRAIYYQDTSFHLLDFFPFDLEPESDAAKINRETPVKCAAGGDLKDVLFSLIRVLAGNGIGVLLKDITHPRFSLDGLCCIRALAPGLFPLWFGAHPQVELTDRLRTLSLALNGRPLMDMDDLNLVPHPFS